MKNLRSQYLASINQKSVESEFTFDKAPLNDLTTASQTGDNFYSFQKRQTRQERTKSSSQPMSSSLLLQQVKQNPRCLNCEILNKKLDEQIQLVEELRALKQKPSLLQTQSHAVLQLENEVKRILQQLHTRTMENGELKKQVLEFKTQVLQREEELIHIQRKYDTEKTQNIENITKLQMEQQEYRYQLSKESKFIESFLHMVNSCQPEGKQFEKLNLKQAWKWMKAILEEYMTLKQKERRKTLTK